MASLQFSSPAVLRRWIFLAFLACLHLILLQGPETQLGRLLLLAHIGLGLLWQPFVQPRRKVGFGRTALVILFAAFSAYFLNWWMLLLWVMLLTGVVGGKVFLFHDRWERLFYLMALGYLTMVALTLALPNSVVALRESNEGLIRLAFLLAPAVLFLMMVCPFGQLRTEDRIEIVDYVYGVFVFLLLAVIVLGTLSFTLLFRVNYFEALLMALALMAGILLLLGFIWDPRSGFGGLGLAVAQHVMSLGLPVEEWLRSLAELAQCEEDPLHFLTLACAELPTRLPGVTGGSWQVGSASGTFGEARGEPVCFQQGSLRLCLLTRVTPSPSLLWHYDLVVRLLAEVLLGKFRAAEVKRLSYIEAIHETGARLTHDVKNLLQSMDTLIVAAGQNEGLPSERFNELLRRQLPEISARLRQTLDKLAVPGTRTQTESVDVQAWLESIRRRYCVDWLRISSDPLPGHPVRVDPALFSSITENLLQNLIDKRHGQPGLEAELRLTMEGEAPVLEVTDTGSAVPGPHAERLFQQRIPSENGLGIGLYQCARQAEAAGYRLSLAENRPGAVRFRLAPQRIPDA